MKTLLEVNNLNLTFEFNSQVVNAVKQSSFKIKINPDDSLNLVSYKNIYSFLKKIIKK